MKAISLLQPWASLVGVKLIETRSWATKYRGPLAIQASKKFTDEQHSLCLSEPFYSCLKKLGYEVVRLNLPTGAIVSICNLVDCIKMTPEFIASVPHPELEFGHYAVGRYAWILEDVKRLEKPIPAKGALSLWEWEALRYPDCVTCKCYTCEDDYCKTESCHETCRDNKANPFLVDCHEHCPKEVTPNA